MTVSKWWWAWVLGGYIALGVVLQAGGQPEGGAYSVAMQTVGAGVVLWAVGYGAWMGVKSLKRSRSLSKARSS